MCADVETAGTLSPGDRHRLIVRFTRDIDLPYDDGLETKRVPDEWLTGWNRIQERFHAVALRRLFRSVTPDRIRQLVQQAVQLDGGYQPADFLRYFVLDHSAEVERHELLAAVRTWNLVDVAYPDPPGSDPAVNRADDLPYSPFQGYLDPAPDGIDAVYAWGLAGGDGAGQDVIDMEQGWTLDHEDLAGHGVGKPLHGNIKDTSRPHGTSVLGVVCASDNTFGIVGIVPNVRSVNVVSYDGSTRADAIMAAIDNLPYGGVLLLEAQVNVTASNVDWMALPIEVLDAEFDVIRLATALGITVVEAAGNGFTDLDTFVDDAGGQPLNRNGAGFRDSGAIMVAAATAAWPHERLRFSNYGSRIDCYGWGERIVTTSSTEIFPFDTALYTSIFGGTSGAVPIVAGAALAVQGVAEAQLTYRLGARQLRDVLSDPGSGTPSNDPAVDRIGVMPDLRNIVGGNVLAFAPDVYVRDFVGDTGAPHAGPVSSSPDVILRPGREQNPQAAFGEGSGTENDYTLGSEAVAGQDNYVYVRIRNRGGTDAANVTARVYWSPPATLVTPDLWSFIGQVVLPNVPSGNVLTVSDEIVWPAGDVPGSGHYCLVAIIGNMQDPGPVPADFLDWARYVRFIRDNNNVTWHNINVVSNSAGPDPASYISLEFLAPGPPDFAREMTVEVGAALPPGSRALLEMPLPLYQAIRGRGPAQIDPDRRTARVRLNRCGLRSFGEILLPARSRTPLRVLVWIPEKRRHRPYELFARQLYKGREVGRITWRLVPAREVEQNREG